MDFTLRCNSLKCRTQLSEQAVVTTCSHIFCLDCAKALGLSNANSIARSCPACSAQLPNQDDAAVSNLSPTEDYKTSVLSGLNPTIIIECASRAMAFWTYQTTQEIFYQEFLMKSMTEKYQSLSGQMDKLIANANAEVSNLRDKLQAATLDCHELDKKNQQLNESYKKKCKDNQQLTKLWHQAKQKQATGLMAEAAEEDASHLTRHLGGEFRPGAAGHHALGMSDNSKSRSDGSSGDRHHGHRITFGLSNKNGKAISCMPNFSLLDTDQARAQPDAEGQRIYLPGSQQGSHHLFRNQLGNDRPPSRIGTPFRQPLGNLATNIFGQDKGSRYAEDDQPRQSKQFHRQLQREAVGLDFGRNSSMFGRQ